MKQNSQSLKQRLWNGLGMGLLLMPIIGYGMPHFSRPDRSPETRSLFPGIDYRREVRSLPRPIVIHIVTIDLTAPEVRAFVTPGMATDNTEINARTTSEFLGEFKLKLAINANFFYPLSGRNSLGLFSAHGRSGERCWTSHLQWADLLDSRIWVGSGVFCGATGPDCKKPLSRRNDASSGRKRGADPGRQTRCPIHPLRTIGQALSSIGGCDRRKWSKIMANFGRWQAASSTAKA